MPSSLMVDFAENIVDSYEKICQKYVERMQIYGVSQEVIDAIEADLDVWIATDPYWGD